MAELDVSPVTFSVNATAPAAVAVTNSSGTQVILLPIPGMAPLDVAPVTFSVNAAPPLATVTNSTGAQVILVPQPGGIGPRGQAGTGAQIFNETPVGAVDGSNTVFTTSDNYLSGSTAVYLNGLREFIGAAYTETSANTVTFSDPPHTGDGVRIDYLIA